MSRIFYDSIATLSKVNKIIKSSSMELLEKEELMKIVDEIVHHRIMGCIFDNLPNEHHEEFLAKFTESPFDEELISYLETHGNNKIKKQIAEETAKLEKELIEEISSKTNK